MPLSSLDRPTDATEAAVHSGTQQSPILVITSSLSSRHAAVSTSRRWSIRLVPTATRPTRGRRKAVRNAAWRFEHSWSGARNVRALTLSHTASWVLPPKGAIPHRPSTPRPNPAASASLATSVDSSTSRPARTMRADGAGAPFTAPRRAIGFHEAIPHARHSPLSTACSRASQASVRAALAACGGSPTRLCSGLWRNTRSGDRPRSWAVSSSAVRSLRGARECSARCMPEKKPTLVEMWNWGSRSPATSASVRWAVKFR